LLNVARIQADELAVVRCPCNLVEIVRNVVEDIQHATPERTFLLSLPEETFVPVSADAYWIGQVVANYLTNACKYSLAGRPITVSLVVEGLFACVSVRDEGPGISLEDQTRIWERFYRAPSVTVQSMQYSDANLGLGLYLCSEIIEQHQGKVGMQSIAGEGSTFWFILPLATPV
jgi:signal transduction histidine kinase